MNPAYPLPIKMRIHKQALREIYKAGYIAGGLGVIQAEVGSRLNSALGAMSRTERRKVMRAVKK